MHNELEEVAAEAAAAVVTATADRPGAIITSAR